jgi:hypothetical protein
MQAFFHFWGSTCEKAFEILNLTKREVRMDLLAARVNISGGLPDLPQRPKTPALSRFRSGFLSRQNRN